MDPRKEKEKRIPRWSWQLSAMIFTAGAWANGRQVWLKYKWGETLGVPKSDLMVSCAAALLFLIAAGIHWYLWLTYNRKK